MTPAQSILTCFRKYATFQGTASRSEYWWFILFVGIVNAVTLLASPWLNAVAALAFFLPALAVSVRRLHDTDHSAWSLLIGLVPIIGALVILVWTLKASVTPNRFGRGDILQLPSAGVAT